ncbi:MAG: precorrin-8X methylmutase, partial [Lachnospiraceae bacterium]|nr:precorrin-8X methylmutase [Lachnospiraceae bacterium]
MKELMHVLPQDIEKESFRIIGEERQAMGVVLPEDQEPVTLRVIHTTADFTFVDSLEFTEGAVEKARELIRQGATIVTDTNMALTGISKPSLAKFGAKAVCFMADPDVAAEAKERGVTRASVSMERAQALE